MEASLKKWVSAWDSMGYAADELDKGAGHELHAAISAGQFKAVLFFESRVMWMNGCQATAKMPALMPSLQQLTISCGACSACEA